MEHDEGYWRFFAYLNLFVAMMLTLVMADNLVLLFVGWEGVGLCSYLLIGFWYRDTEKAFAGRKAFITNRIGDFAFIIGMILLVLLLGATEKMGPTHGRATSSEIGRAKAVARLAARAGSAQRRGAPRVGAADAARPGRETTAAMTLDTPIARAR